MPIADPDPVPDGPTEPAKPVAPDGPPEPAEPTERSLTRPLLDDLRSFAQADAAQLDDLASLLDDLRKRAGTFADDTFDTEGIWARVDREVFG